MPLPRPSSPRIMLSDLSAFLRERHPHQWAAAAFAFSVTIGIIVLFVIDGRTNIAPGPQLIYVESWGADRTDEQIRADQLRDQKKREGNARERQRQFQKLERDLGMK